VPLYTVAVGNEEPLTDVALSDLLVDDVVFVDDLVYFEARLSAAGCDGKSVVVELRDKATGQLLASSPATLGANGESQRIRVPHRPTKEGTFDYVLQVEPLAEEVDQGNNRLEQTVTVRKQKIRVLMAQSYPNYEFRFLKHVLERDRSAIELSVVLQEADLEYAEQDQSALRGFPTKRDDLFAYDVIIFGDVNPNFLGGPTVANLADFVTERGGGLIRCTLRERIAARRWRR
jgi:hypothetical protein